MKKNTLLLGVILLTIFSACNNELHITLPEGPQGMSAYEVWVEGVQDGTISWDKERTDINNYFLYLKGKDGKDGADGKSAYAQWVEEVAQGIADPQDQSQQWDKSKTSTQDFWRYLTGAKGQSGSAPTVGSNGNWFIDGDDSGIAAKGKDGENGNNGQNGSVVIIGGNGNWFIDDVDTNIKAFGVDGQDGEDGKSAYALWVEEVAIGIEDPHNPGQQWDSSKTSAQDFWAFLRGKDGSDGTSGEGKDIEIVNGVPNVIPQYSYQANNEFVRLDGSVMYFVYDHLGQKVGSGVIVTKLPGMDPAKTYTTDTEGRFMILKEDLPTNKPKEERSGISSVTYDKAGVVVTENSAKNTYVPAKVDVRMRLVNGSDLIQSYMRINVLVERKTEPNGVWEIIPSHLGDEIQSIAAYGLSDPLDPSSYDVNKVYRVSSTTYNIKENPIVVQVYRLRREAEYLTVDVRDKWDGNRHFLTLVLDSYYGEKPHLSGIIEMAPIQAMPFIRMDNMTATESTDPEVNSKSLLTLSGSLDIAGASLDASIVYQKNLIVTAESNYDLCSPVQLDYKDLNIFRILMQKDTNTSQSYKSANDPDFELFQPLYNADFSLTVIGETRYVHCFYNYNKIGVLKKNGDKQYVIESASSFPNVTISVATL